MEPHSFEDAYEQALRFLEPRFLSTYEMMKKLDRKGYEKSVCTAVVEKLKDLDYINDKRLSQQVTEYLMREECYGVLYIKNKLRQRGLVATESLQEYDEVPVARALWQKKKNSSKKELSKEKCMRYLYNRGFTQGTIFAILKESLT